MRRPPKCDCRCAETSSSGSSDISSSLSSPPGKRPVRYSSVACSTRFPPGKTPACYELILPAMTNSAGCLICEGDYEPPFGGIIRGYPGHPLYLLQGAYGLNFDRPVFSCPPFSACQYYSVNWNRGTEITPITRRCGSTTPGPCEWQAQLFINSVGYDAPWGTGVSGGPYTRFSLVHDVGQFLGFARTVDDPDVSVELELQTPGTYCLDLPDTITIEPCMPFNNDSL